MIEDTESIQSFKEVLLNRNKEINLSYTTLEESEQQDLMEDLDIDSIQLSTEDKRIIYQSWSLSMIVKVFGKKIAHTYLKNKLVDLWKPSEPLTLIDLGLKKWEQNFVPDTSTLTHTAIWARLPQLPTKFYDRQILEKVGEKLGSLLKIDTCTSAALRGRYAHICIQVSLENPVKTRVRIGNHIKKMVYERDRILCNDCGRLGHTLLKCPHKQLAKQPNDDNNTTTTKANGEPTKPATSWQVVTFPRKKGAGKMPMRNGQQHGHNHLKVPPGKSI
ncbi:hypothetical protein R3W88_033761 [Solanum pinnatisectum]|uniref:CCHC-type domain-containing protein n=1 Tax=Solanum pinnatisectum TaxID=50273 RepID=A0AAV9K0D4_9SOLN|nr:hypothetical protein R3W88_033761 [Solanum pinnatisectum]